MFLTYFVPIGCMTYTYTRVGLELWGSQSIGECTQRQLDNIKSKRKVSRSEKDDLYFLLDVGIIFNPQGIIREKNNPFKDSSVFLKL